MLLYVTTVAFITSRAVKTSLLRKQLQHLEIFGSNYGIGEHVLLHGVGYWP